jgi:aminomethyltransferase
MIDLSPLRKYEVTGPDAEALMQLCVTRNVAKLATGQITYTAMCYETGGMIDDGTVFRLSDDHFRWIGGVDTSGIWLREIAIERGMDVSVRSSTDQLHNVQVQGPRSRDTMAPVFTADTGHPDLDELGWFRFTFGTVAGVDVMISRTGYSGELGFEVFCHPTDAPTVWDAIW